MADALCLGEILVDWVCTTPGADLDTAVTFTKAAGGAPANVAVGLARQGVSTAFIGRVSRDAFGSWLRALLQQESIDTTCTVADAEANTRMAYVVTTDAGDRKLAEFSHIACADTRLSVNDLSEDMFHTASLLHFGSISLIAEPARSTTLQAIELAKSSGLLVSYDPNVRLGLWPSADLCKRAILETLPHADVIKINADELEFLTGSRDLAAAQKLQEHNNTPLLVVTLDSRGAFFARPTGTGTVPGFCVELVESTGAGDGFVSGLLAGLLPLIKTSTNRPEVLKSIPLEALESIVKRANAAGAMTCTRPGAIPALPRCQEIDLFLSCAAVKAPS